MQAGPARAAGVLIAAALVVTSGCVQIPGSEADAVIVGTTTSLRDTGLLDVLAPAFTEATGIPVRPVVVGSGAAMELARRGDVDALVTHAPARERALVADGVVVYREPVMANHFILVGPADDPAGARGAMDAADAFARVRDAEHRFASRGDGSGTHEKELALWHAAGADPSFFSREWYKQLDQGQAGTLRYASEKRAYALTDEGTWWTLRDRGVLPGLAVVHEGDAVLRNPYAVLPVADGTVPEARAERGAAFAAWLTGPDGQALIREFTVNGRQLFTPAADAEDEPS